MKTSEYNDHLKNGTTVKRKDDGVIGIIEDFGHRFQYKNGHYDAYYVRWSDGHLGFPNENSFEVVNK